MRTEVTPSTSSAAAVTASARAGVVMMLVGSDEPAGKCWASTSCPVTDSGCTRNCSVWDRPVRRPAMPDPSAARRSRLTMATGTGRLVTTAPTLDQKPLRVGSSWPGRGTNGQNSPRPNSSSAAGRTSRA